MSVFTCGRGPENPMYCETCQKATWWVVSGCGHQTRFLKVGDTVKAAGMQVPDSTMGTVDFVEPGRYGVTWDEER